MKTCGTCKHWGNEKDASETFRKCTAVIHDVHGRTTDTGFNLDEADWLDEEEKEEIRSFRRHHLAVVVDGSGYMAALRVQSDFGCKLHEDA